MYSSRFCVVLVGFCVVFGGFGIGFSGLLWVLVVFVRVRCFF